MKVLRNLNLFTKYLQRVLNNAQNIIVIKSKTYFMFNCISFNRSLLFYFIDNNKPHQKQ